MTGRRIALLVANDRYEHVTLPPLAAPTAEAAELAEVLADDTLGGFDVDLLCNATSQAVYERLDQLFTDDAAADLVLVHFAGHGLRSEDGELHLAVPNTQPALLASTSVDAGRVFRLMRRSRAGSVVLLLDCCFGGAFAKGVIPHSGQEVDVRSSFAAPELSGGRGHVVVTAASATEFAYELGNLVTPGSPPSSLFTRALIDGILTGDADLDQDGRIDLDELYEFVERRVVAAYPDQHPNRWYFGSRGKIYVAHSTRRRIRPGTLPEQIRDLLDHGAVSFQRAAVLELRDIAEGPDLPQVAAARATLARLAHDDSRKVSLAAQDALAATAVQLSQSTVDLGVARAGAASETQVQLRGGPLAHASTVLAPPAVRARIVGDTLRLRLSGDRPGPVDTTVTVTGPAGDATVQVTGWVALDPRLPAAAAVSLAGSLTEDPQDQASALAAAAWATHHAGGAALARTLLDRAGDIADPLSHALVTALVNWTGARCGDARRAARVPGDLAGAVRIVCTDPRDRAIALAALAWLGHARSPDPAPPHGPSWWPMVHEALRSRTRGKFGTLLVAAAATRRPTARPSRAPTPPSSPRRRRSRAGPSVRWACSQRPGCSSDPAGTHRPSRCWRTPDGPSPRSKTRASGPSAGPSRPGPAPRRATAGRRAGSSPTWQTSLAPTTR
ncbi:caspase, EACC1-associated type [Dactylosporangium sp. CA-152071]|uniref:caspase family protein n=1 Tax=Dactylosporangium sp. CA-152071 TaxID=3239933 RepID=UPI003D914284